MLFRILSLIFFAALCQPEGVCAQTNSLPERRRADLEWLRKELPTLHPGFFDRYPAKSFNQDIDDLEGRLAGLTDFQFALEVQALLAQARDAALHLELNALLQRERVIPIGLGWYGGGIYVSGTVQRFEQALGKKVLKINDLKAEDALERMGRYVARENEYSIRKDAPTYLRFPPAFRLAGVSTSDTLRLLVEDAQGKRATVAVYPIDMSKRTPDLALAQINPDHRDLRWLPPTGPFALQWEPEDSVLYVRYNSCVSQEMSLATGDSATASRLPPFQPFADSLVSFARHHPSAKMLIDLRFNPGGNATDGAALARRLAEVPTLNRKDKLFVAINFYTASAAIQVAAVFAEHTEATLLGEPTPQRPNQYAAGRSARLPNTGLIVAYPTQLIRLSKGDPDRLEPDQKIVLTFEDFRQGKDPVLDFVRRVR